MLFRLLLSIIPSKQNLFEHFIDTEIINECMSSSPVLTKDSLSIYEKTVAELERRECAMTSAQQAAGAKRLIRQLNMDRIQAFFRKNWPTRYEDLPRAVQAKVDQYRSEIDT